MQSDAFETPGVFGNIEIVLDGMPVVLPFQNRSINAIRGQLETLALERQRVLSFLSIDGQPVNLALPLKVRGTFCRIEAGSIALENRSRLLLKTAFEQTDHARECVETALTLVLINNGAVACEVWWNLARQLKEPVLTLSLLPETDEPRAQGQASLIQLRKWQLEQLGMILREVAAVCHGEDVIQISNALENRVLPWLQGLGDLIQLWYETELSGSCWTTHAICG